MEPDSEMAPAIRFMIMALGCEVGTTSANTSWVSLLMPETGFRSVSPRARTPIIERRRARTTARMVAYRGMRVPKVMWVAPMQISIDARRPMKTIRLLTRCSGGASTSGSSLSSSRLWDERFLEARLVACCWCWLELEVDGIRAADGSESSTREYPFPLCDRVKASFQPLFFARPRTSPTYRLT